MDCVKEGKVRVDVLKVNICYDNTLLGPSWRGGHF